MTSAQQHPRKKVRGVLAGISVALGILDGVTCQSLGAWTEAIPFLLVFCLAIIALSRPQDDDQDFALASALRPLAATPILFVAVFTLCNEWWNPMMGFEGELFSAEVWVATSTLMVGLPSGWFVWFLLTNLVKRPWPNLSPSTTTLRRISFALLVVTLVLTALGAYRRIVKPSAETVRFAAVSTLASSPLLATPQGRIVISRTHELRLCPPVAPHLSARNDRISVCVFQRLTGALVPLFSFVYPVSPQARISIEPRTGIVTITSRSERQRGCASIWFPGRKASVVACAKELSPTFPWILMGLFAVGFALFATRNRNPLSSRWIPASFSNDELRAEDGTNLALMDGVSVPKYWTKLWVVVEPASEQNESPFRTADRCQAIAISAVNPVHEERVRVLWGLCSATLLITPLVLAAGLGMLTD